MESPRNYDKTPNSGHNPPCAVVPPFLEDGKITHEGVIPEVFDYGSELIVQYCVDCGNSIVNPYNPCPRCGSTYDGYIL